MFFKSVDYFKILGINKNASSKDIKIAYYKLAKEWHPDQNKRPDAVRRFRLITEAYEVLKDHDKRAEYILSNTEYYKDNFKSSSNENSYYQDGNSTSYDERKNSQDQFRSRMRGLLFFERLIHPRTLIILLPVYLLGSLIYYGVYPVDSNIKKYGKGQDNEMIDAWYNSKKKRWETPAPWNNDYLQCRNNGEIVKKHWKEVHRSTKVKKVE